MADVKSLKKDGNVAFKQTKYNYLSEAKTTATLREQFVKHGIVIYPLKAEETKNGNVTHGHYTFRLVNADKPEEFIDIQSTGQGQDSSDKGSGKAQSYAFKYALWRAFAIPSNDDPDQISSAEHEAEEAKKREFENTKIDNTRFQALELMLDETESDKIKFCAFFKVSSINELTNKQWVEAMDMLTKKKK
jgi:hypothetical protein